MTRSSNESKDSKIEATATTDFLTFICPICEYTQTLPLDIHAHRVDAFNEVATVYHCPKCDKAYSFGSKINGR